MPIDSTGYVAYRLSELLGFVRAEAISVFGTEINLSASSKFGQLLGVFAGELAMVSEQTQAVYDAYSLNNAQGQFLDNIAMIMGYQRKNQTKSIVFVSCTGSGTAAIPIASIIRNTSNEEFVSTAAGIVGGDAIPFEAVEYGDVDVSAGALDSGAGAQIITPIVGWTSIDNDDGFHGRGEETDAELRIRVQTRGAVTGVTTLDGMFTSLTNALTSASYVTVMENVTDAVDVYGIPPNSVAVCVHPPGVNSQTIAQAIFNTKSAGIEAWGSTSDTAVDLQGRDHTIGFSYSSEVEVYAEISVTPLSGYSGDAFVREAVQTWVNALALGEDIYPAQLLCHLKSVVDGAIVYGVETKLSGGSYSAELTEVGPFDIAHITDETTQVTVI